jgi:hypothetical protein
MQFVQMSSLNMTVPAQIGVEALAHVHDLEVQDLEEVGMARPERKRFMRALCELSAGMHDANNSDRRAKMCDEGRLMEKILSAPHVGASASRRDKQAHFDKRKYGEGKRDNMCVQDAFSGIDSSSPLPADERERFYLEDCDVTMTSLSGRALTSSASSQTATPRSIGRTNISSASGSCSNRYEDLGSARSGEGESSSATMLSQACTGTPPSATRTKRKHKAASTLMDCSKLLARARSICSISVPAMHTDQNEVKGCGFLVAFEEYGITAVVTSCQVLPCQKHADEARLYFSMRDDVSDKEGTRVEFRLETSLLWWQDEALGVCVAACRGRTAIGVDAVPALLGASQGSPDDDVLVLHPDSKRKLTCHRITSAADGEFQFSAAASCLPMTGCPVSMCHVPSPQRPCTIHMCLTFLYTMCV